MSGQWDAPNQQVVRPDQSAPWDEGSGGSSRGEPAPKGLDEMTKAQLLDYAADHGVAADDSMTKAEIRAAIDAGGG